MIGKIRLIKRNHKLFNINKIYERLTLVLIRDNDNALQRSIKAVEYIDEEIKNMPKNGCRTRLEEVRKILTHYKTNNLLKEMSNEVKKNK